MHSIPEHPVVDQSTEPHLKASGKKKRSICARPQSVHSLLMTCVVFRPTPARRRPSWRLHGSWWYPHTCLGPAGAQKPRCRAQQVGLLAPPWCPGNYSPPDTICTDRFTYNKYAKHTPALEKQPRVIPLHRGVPPRGQGPHLFAKMWEPHNSGVPMAISNFSSCRERLLHRLNPDAPLANTYMRISQALRHPHQRQQHHAARTEAHTFAHVRAHTCAKVCASNSSSCLSSKSQRSHPFRQHRRGLRAHRALGTVCPRRGQGPARRIFISSRS